jgi:hypothetical protein
MEKINIITRCSRPNNLLEVSKSVFNTDKFNVIWHLIFDTNVIKEINVELLLHLQSLNTKIKFEQSIQGDHGHQMVNHCIDDIQDGWVYMLDDDNILHSDFYDRIDDIIENNTDKRGIIFNQKIGGIDFTGQDIRFCSPENVKVSKIDMAQFLLRRDFIGDRRIVLGQYVGDGIFIESIYKENTEEFIFINEILCYYNYFDQNKKPNKKFLPRVLLIGTDSEVDLKSQYVADFESTDIFTLNSKDDKELDSKITRFDPDSIVTIGDSFDKFQNLCAKSFDVRRRWVHFPTYEESVGNAAYYCASNYILTPH